MQHISSSQFKSQLGEYLSLSRDETIMVQKAGKNVAVVMSPAEYEYLQGLEDAYWIARAESAKADGEWISHDDAVKLLADRLGKQA